MERRELFAAIHQRPGMWGLDGSYGQFCAFLLGYDEGTVQSLLTGFNEWLRMRFHEGHKPTNIGWTSLVLWLAFPERWRPTPLWADSAVPVYELDIPAGAQTDLPEANEDARRAVETLFHLLDEFLDVRLQCLGLAEIFRDYAVWLEKEAAGGSSEHIAQRILGHLNDEPE